VLLLPSPRLPRHYPPRLPRHPLPLLLTVPLLLLQVLPPCPQRLCRRPLRHQ
jgi:hypothetical protein